ncbi:hypothetical protein, variant 1 [Puccinia triticina 1-1 BBBD Race 1]|uniref:SP-RING-type domain-containing protein n=1 Tax=Puccinia triticina (isolate 1-1 / race 1 (BBBD)) TaxID=630390 RepID=A0A180GEQ5_PUCT1|nr:hypothetical protein, variant 1 [Puccinia triticina 1-1 BBBD Race 1]
MATVAQDFSKLRSFLPSLRVEELKGIIRTINGYLHTVARLTGKKDELIVRIEGYLQESLIGNKLDNYDYIRAAIYRYCREPYTPTYLRNTLNTYLQAHQTHPASTVLPSSSAASSSLRVNAPVVDQGPAPTPSNMRSGFPIKQPSNHNQNYSANSGINPNPPSQGFPPKPHQVHPSYSHAPFNSRALPISFEKSPFYRVDSAASGVAICHRAAQNDRKSVPLSLILSADQRAKMSQTHMNAIGSQYQLRLFATSEAFYNHPSYATGPHTQSLPPALIEFPTTTDIKLNTCSITSNLKGIKKQPGTAPPPDLALVPGRNGSGQALDLKEGRPNQIEIAYSNSDKRFYFVIYLVEYFGVYGLMKNLKANRKRGHDQVLQEIIASSGDEDVMTSASEVTLKDPVVFSRIKTPIRSTRCKHLQCFDAEMFYTMMEQTPTWLCPVCNSKLKNDDIAVDEYFESILKAAPSSIDTVVIEADGKWHDEKFEHGTSLKKRASQSVMSGESGASGSRPSGGVGGAHKQGAPSGLHGHPDGSLHQKRKVTVLELESDDNAGENDDDDDDDDDQESSRAQPAKRHKAFGHAADCVIDLTLDDD